MLGATGRLASVASVLAVRLVNLKLLAKPARAMATLGGSQSGEAIRIWRS